MKHPIIEVQTFTICQEVMGEVVTLNPSVITINGQHYLVDCGYEETFPAFEKALLSLGIPLTYLTGIIISHDDIDHLGALTLFLEKNKQLVIYSSEIEADSIEGKIKSERLVQAENSLATLPIEYKPWAENFIQRLNTINRTEIDKTFADKDWLAGAVQVIATPGHTKGHISLYIPSQKTVIANDALVIEEYEFNIANPQFTLDIKQALASVKRIASLNIAKVICYHGGIMVENVNEKLQKLLSRYEAYH